MIKVVYTKPQIMPIKEGCQINIHPRTNAVVSASEQALLRQRSQHVQSIDKDGTLAWIITLGYYRQSAVYILNQFRLLGSP